MTNSCPVWFDRMKIPNGEEEKRMTAFDYKKEYKEFYLPPRKPQIVEVPEMNFLAVRGMGIRMKKKEIIRRQSDCCIVLLTPSK